MRFPSPQVAQTDEVQSLTAVLDPIALIVTKDSARGNGIGVRFVLCLFEYLKEIFDLVRGAGTSIGGRGLVVEGALVALSGYDPLKEWYTN